MRKELNRLIIYTAIIIGAALLYIFFKLNALYFFIFLVSAVIYLIAKNNKLGQEDKRFLIALILLIFISRFILSLFVMNARGAALTQDEGLYSKKAIMKIFEMKETQNLETLFYEYFDYDYDMKDKNYGYNPYTYLLTCFYYLFGYQIQAARLINIFFNIILFLLIFFMTKELFGSRTAKISSTILAFFPSIMLWSVMIGVDMIMLICLSAYMFSLIKILKRFDIKWLFVMGVSVFIVNSIRRHIAVVLLLVGAVMLIYKMIGGLTKKGKPVLAALAAILIFVLLRSPIIDFAKGRLQEGLYTLIQHQKNLASIDDSGYLIYPEHSYQMISLSARDISKAYLKGMSYVLFSPFPWRIESKQQLMAYPQVTLWYFMLPFILYGFYIGFRTNRLPTLSIFLYAFLVFSIFALVEGNIGALFRHRDMVTPFLLVFFGVGINKFLLKNISR